jgi:peptidoglycan-N-acetylglucosamine deacetylase
MDTTSTGADESLGVAGLGWTRLPRRPFRPLLLLVVACQPLALLLLLGGPWPWGIVVLTLSHGALLAGIFIPTLSWFGRTYTRVSCPEGSAPRVWLTIDDGPDPRTTPEILDVLRRFGATATFFVIGEKASRHPELLGRIAAEGHQIANHSTHHPVGTFWCLPPGRVEDEIRETSRIIEAGTGHVPAWIRPPVGHQNPFLHPIAARHDLGVVTWSASGWDGIRVPLERAVDRIARKTTAGSILVVHEGYEPRARGYAPAALVQRILEHAERRGYTTFVPTSATDLE